MKIKSAKNPNLVELSNLVVGETFLAKRSNSEEIALYLIIDKNSGLFRNGNLTGAKLALNLVTAQVRRFFGCELVERIDCYVQIEG